MTACDYDVIAIGEPGCYVIPGHVPFDVCALAVESYCRLELGYGSEEICDHLPPRHTWMTITPGEWEDELYTEVRTSTVGAKPFTLVAIDGYWKEPDACPQKG